MRRTREAQIVRAVQACLTDPLRRPRYRGHANKLRGHCAVASEAVYFLLGGKRAGWTPQTIRIGDETHWYLRRGNRVVDPTAGQFSCEVPYARGRGRGFPTPRQGSTIPPPSKRAQIVIRCVQKRLKK